MPTTTKNLIIQVISYDSTRGGVSVITEKGDVTTSYLLIQNADLADSGKYSCSPSNADVASVRVHVLNGKCFLRYIIIIPRIIYIILIYNNNANPLYHIYYIQYVEHSVYFHSHLCISCLNIYPFLDSIYIYLCVNVMVCVNIICSYNWYWLCEQRIELKTKRSEVKQKAIKTLHGSWWRRFKMLKLFDWLAVGLGIMMTHGVNTDNTNWPFNTADVNVLHIRPNCLHSCLFWVGRGGMGRH